MRFLFTLCAAAVFAIAANAQPLASHLPTIPVIVEGVRFTAEVVTTPGEQYRGLGGRTWIDPNGGMLFPFAQPQKTAFVMRDCPIAIDVAFLDEGGHVLALHEMKPEEPRRPGESAAAYDARLREYSSGGVASWAFETAGGRLRALGLEVGERVQIELRPPTRH